jgi:pyruvate dehydrogenase E2 component (dihydrolipoamide acetyltransferase)
LVERVPLRGARRKVAEAMVRSLAAAAQVTTTDEARVQLLWHIREKEKGLAAAQGVHLTLLAFVAKAAVTALKRDPWLNAQFDEERGEVILKGYYHVGVAVETRDGLLVPVVRDVDRKTVVEVAREIQDLSARARERSLGVDDLRGGTFTLSNYGSIGGRYATPILNPPEVGLLGLGRVADQPVAVDGALKVEKVLPLSLTFDHRVVDGATAQHFLRNVVLNLEDPDRFLVVG